MGCVTAGVKRAVRARVLPRMSWMHVTVVAVGVAAAILNLTVINAKVATQPIAVLATDLGAGSVLRADDLAYAAIQAPADVVASLVGREQAAEVEGLVVTRAMSAGELLTRDDLRPPGAPSDLRAYSIPLPPERAVAGALSAGDRVDVVVAHDGTAAFLAGGLEVISVTGGEGGIGLSSFSVTVAADAETILQVAAALEYGTVSLVRSTGAAPPTVWDLAPEEDPDA